MKSGLTLFFIADKNSSLGFTVRATILDCLFLNLSNSLDNLIDMFLGEFSKKTNPM